MKHRSRATNIPTRLARAAAGTLAAPDANTPLPNAVGDEGNTRTRIKPLEVLIPIGIALLALIVFVPANPFFGLYLLALSALTIGPAFFLRSKGWGMLPLFLATPALGFSLDSFMTRLGWYNVQEYMDNSWPMGLSQDSIALAAGLALIGNAIFWLGFFLPLSRGLGERLFNKFKTSLTANTGQPREWRIWVAFAAGIVTRLYLVKAGVGGYFATDSARGDALPYVQFLVLVDGLTSLALSLYFITLLRGRGLSWWRFAAMFAVELLSVLLLGFKGQIVIRFLTLATAYVFVRRRLPWSILLAGVVTLIIVFPINMAARAAFGSGQIQAGNLGSIQQGYVSAAQQSTQGTSVTDFVSQNLQQIFHNSGQLEPFSMVVQYVNETGDRLGGGEYLAPITSLIPRALWPSKPETAMGNFVYTHVYGLTGGTAVAQTVPGDFYLNFGWPGVLVGLLLLGMFHRIVLPLFWRTTSLRYLPLVPVVAVTLFFTNADFGGFMAGIIRTTVFSILVLRVLVPQPRRLNEEVAERVRRVRHRGQRAPMRGRQSLVPVKPQ